MHTPHVIATAASPASPAAPRPVPPPLPRQQAGKPGHRPDEGGGLRILTYLRLHWLMIAFCGTLLGGAGAYAAWELLASKYESYALMQVASVPASIASGGNREQARTDFVTYLKTTSTLIKSEFVLNAALRDIKDLPTIKAQKDPIKFLDEELMVTWQDGSEVIRITFKSHVPADAKKIVDAVQNAFMKEVVEKDVLEKKDILSKIEAAKLEMLGILNRKTEKEKPATKGPNATDPAVTPAGGMGPADMAKEMPGAMPPAPLPPIAPGGAAAAPVAPPPNPAVLQSDTADRLNQLDPHILLGKLSGLMNEAERLPLAINDGKRRLVVLQEMLKAIKEAPISQLTLDAVEKDQEVFGQSLEAKAAHRKWQFYANGGDANSPGALRLKATWDAHEAKLTAMKKEKAETIETVKRVAEANRVAEEMNALIRILQREQEQLDFVRNALAKGEKQLMAIPLPSDKGGIMQADGRAGPEYNPADSDLRMTDNIFSQLVRQYYLARMELGSPPRVRPLQAGSNPTQKEMKKQVMGTIFAALLGFGLIGFGVVAVETSAKRISSLADVKAATPAPVVGVIPGQPIDAMGKDPAKRTAANEAIDKLRTFVAQTWLARGATTIAVTSALSDEGKAFTAFGLASSLAQSGYKTLLVDFDLRDPQLHEIAGITNEAGVCELLRAEIDPRSAVQFLPSGLHLLPAGKWSDEARKAATGEKLEAAAREVEGAIRLCCAARSRSAHGC